VEAHVTNVYLTTPGINYQIIKLSKIMKKVLFTAVCCLATVMSFGQVLAGVTVGTSLYKWDKNPTTGSVEYNRAAGGIFSEIVGLNLGLGNDKFRFILEGYETYAPFTFNLKKFAGMGTFSGGAMAKISVTPFEHRDGNRGFSLGAGIEMTRTEISFRKKELERDWFPIKYGYLAYSVCEEDGHTLTQTDWFGKVGIGENSAIGFEVGVRRSFLLGF
jgi:hypothetical protein